MMNPVTGKTYATFEPALDYIVSKIPDGRSINLNPPTAGSGHANESDRGSDGDRKYTGRNLSMKAVRSLEMRMSIHLGLKDAGEISNEVLEKRIKKAGDRTAFLPWPKRSEKEYTVERPPRI